MAAGCRSAAGASTIRAGVPTVDFEAKQYDIPGLLTAIRAYYLGAEKQAKK